MSEIKLNAGDKTRLIEKLQQYFNNELDFELGQFDADFLLDFFSKEFGAYYYNQGLYDAQALLTNKLEMVAEQIVELEQAID